MVKKLKFKSEAIWCLELSLKDIQESFLKFHSIIVNNSDWDSYKDYNRIGIIK